MSKYAFVNPERTIVMNSETGALFPWSPTSGRPNLRAGNPNDFEWSDFAEERAVQQWWSDGRPTPAGHKPPPRMVDDQDRARLRAAGDDARRRA